MDRILYAFRKPKPGPDKLTKLFSALRVTNHTCIVHKKKGYSGVGILAKQTPDHVEYGMNIEKYDQEGRLTANHINTAGEAIVPAQGKRIKAGGLITI